MKSALRPASYRKLSGWFQFYGRSGLIWLMLIIGSCSSLDEPVLPASNSVLAENRSIIIGGRLITAPVITFFVSTSRAWIVKRDSDHESPQQISVNELLTQTTPNTPIEGVMAAFSFDSLRSLQDYQTDQHVDTTEDFCMELSEDWAQNYCFNGSHEQTRILIPRRFILIEKNYLSRNSVHLSYYGGMEQSLGDAARKMMQEQRFPNRLCHGEQTIGKNRLCSYINQIGNDLYVVWSGSEEEPFPIDYSDPKLFIIDYLLGSE
ncbi:MAG: hypothetical protein D6B25_01760 [Desulfobulbaceae bacterium]|nr:MAG: hypothetical protein D6B25_01760 [Desulfobulbaceae bacterium]